MSYSLFIDDERFPPEDGKDWVVVRTSCEATLYVARYGMPDYISFDHDLGGCDTSMKFVAWLTEAVLDNRVCIPLAFNYYIHSQNPVGSKNIKGKMDSLIAYARSLQCLM
jgi:hypothetical protein